MTSEAMIKALEEIRQETHRELPDREKIRRVAKRALGQKTDEKKEAARS